MFHWFNSSAVKDSRTIKFGSTELNGPITPERYLINSSNNIGHSYQISLADGDMEYQCPVKASEVSSILTSQPIQWKPTKDGYQVYKRSTRYPLAIKGFHPQ